MATMSGVRMNFARPGSMSPGAISPATTSVTPQCSSAKDTAKSIMKKSSDHHSIELST